MKCFLEMEIFSLYLEKIFILKLLLSIRQTSRLEDKTGLGMMNKRKL